MEQESAADVITKGHMLWAAVLVWFSSSLLSQSAYMAVHGLPYDAVAMLKQLGPLYYIVIVAELAFWVGLVVVGVKKFSKSGRSASSSPLTPA